MTCDGEAKQSPGPPMTLSNMRELGPQTWEASSGTVKGKRKPHRWRPREQPRYFQ
jgi:hypothetical protein